MREVNPGQVVKHISDQISVLYLGQCVERAPSEELFENPLHPYTKALLEAIPIPRITARRKQHSNPITGELSSPIEPEKGCRFAPRCPFATAGCQGEDIPLTEVSPSHFVSCYKVL